MTQRHFSTLALQEAALLAVADARHSTWQWDDVVFVVR